MHIYFSSTIRSMMCLLSSSGWWGTRKPEKLINVILPLIIIIIKGRITLYKKMIY